MSQADNLFENMSETDIAMYATDPASEGHIIVGSDRFITVPESLKRIGVESDHNIETVTFGCPRYWDGYDLLSMVVYINYMRADGYKDSIPATNVAVHPENENLIRFNWTISRNVTKIKGKLSFLVCAKDVDAKGNEILHWNSELNRDMYVSEGLEADNAGVIDESPDIITALLLRMNDVEALMQDVDKTLVEVIELQEYYINGGDLTQLPDARGVEI